MASITDLRQKRAALWEKTKKFLDNAKRENDMLSAEDVETYEKMESEIVALGKEIDILERQAEMEKRLNSPVNTPVLETPKTNGNTKTGRASNEYKQAFWKLMKNNQLSYSVHDTLQIGTDSDGGYLVPDEYETVLIDKLADENIMRGLATIITSANGDKKIPVFRYIFASCKSVNKTLVKLASGSVIDIHDTCFRLVESSITDQSFLTIILTITVFDVHQHTKTVLEWYVFKFRIIQLVAERICHSSKAHFN